MYATATVIIAGALDEEREFTDETLMNEWLADIEREANGDGYRADVYVLWHEHDPGIECECAQYAQDHRPYRTFNPGGAT